MYHSTWPRPFQRRFVIRSLGLTMFNPRIKFEMSTITCNEEMKGNVKWAITSRCLRDPMFSRFDTIPACDTQTHTETQTR